MFSVYSDLENKHSSLCMASSYQDILLWLLNIGLLPEAYPHNDKINVGNDRSSALSLQGT